MSGIGGPKLVSSSALRVRTAWFPILIKVENGVTECHLCWKYSDGSIGFFSNSDKNSKFRPAWDYIRECYHLSKKDSKGEEHETIVFQNRRLEKKAFKTSEMNPSLWNVNDFTSKLIEMRNEGKHELMALYFSVMFKSEGFVCYQDSICDQDGFQKDGGGITIQKLVQAAGSLDDYKDFREKAIHCRVDVAKRDEALKSVVGVKRKIDHGFVAMEPMIKQTKAERLEIAQEEELTSSDGVEVSYHSQYIGRADIPLANLEESKKVYKDINPFKVHGLVKAMRTRMDQSQISLTVVPKEGVDTLSTAMKKCREKGEDESSVSAILSNFKYEVIHGRHR